MILFSYARSLLSWLLIALSTIFWGTLSILSVPVSPGGELSHLCMRRWGQTILLACGIRVKTTGIENVSAGEVQIFASNHQSFFDVWVLCAVLPVRFGWIIKKELMKIPFLGAHMRINGYVTIDRSDRERAIASMDQAADQIRQGRRIAIFPEGTRSRDGNLGPLKKGLFHLCLKTGVPLVPIFIEGTGNTLKPDSLLITPGTIRVAFGTPLATSGYAEERLDSLVEDYLSSMETLRRFIDVETPGADAA